MIHNIIYILRDIPIILCTGYSENISQEGAQDIGINSLYRGPLIKQR